MSYLLHVFCGIGSFLMYFSTLILVLTIVSHLYTKFKRPPPLKLASESVVLIVGACTGIGKLMALIIA
jgi:hypothetical protein